MLDDISSSDDDPNDDVVAVARLEVGLVRVDSEEEEDPELLLLLLLPWLETTCADGEEEDEGIKYESRFSISFFIR